MLHAFILKTLQNWINRLHNPHKQDTRDVPEHSYGERAVYWLYIHEKIGSAKSVIRNLRRGEKNIRIYLRL